MASGFLSLFVSTMLVFTSATFTSPTQQETEQIQKLVWAVKQDQVTTLDPLYASSDIELSVVNNCMEGLTRNDGEHVKLGIASKIDVLENGRKFIFSLKRTRWSDGSLLTAYDFEYAWKRLQIEGKRDGDRTILEDGGIKNFGALDLYTFEVVTYGPSTNITYLVSSPKLFPVKRNLVRQKDWSLDVNLSVVNGPYKFSGYSKNDKLLMVKNRNYWNYDQLNVDQIECLFTSSPEVGMSLFKRGRVDLFEDVPLDYVKQFMSSEDAFKMLPSPKISTILFNPKSPVFNKVDNRKAFEMTIDRITLEDQFLTYGQEMARKLLPYKIYRLSNYYRSNYEDFIRDDEISKVENATSLLGTHLNEVRKTPIKIMILNEFKYKKYAYMLKEMWENNLGVSIDVSVVSHEKYLEEINKGQFDLTITDLNWSSFNEKGLVNSLGEFEGYVMSQIKTEMLQKSGILVPLAYESKNILMKNEWKAWNYDGWGNWYFGEMRIL